MSTISKLPNGRFKAIIRGGQRVLKTKTFTRPAIFKVVVA